MPHYNSFLCSSFYLVLRILICLSFFIIESLAIEFVASKMSRRSLNVAMYSREAVRRWESATDQLPPLVEPPPPVAVDAGRYSHRSIETLVVVLAVITIVAVFAGIIARMCGGRHHGGSGEQDIEGWVERKCRSCIDGGLPPPAAQETKPAAAAAAAAATEEQKK